MLGFPLQFQLQLRYALLSLFYNAAPPHETQTASPRKTPTKITHHTSLPSNARRPTFYHFSPREPVPKTSPKLSWANLFDERRLDPGAPSPDLVITCDHFLFCACQASRELLSLSLATPAGTNLQSSSPEVARPCYYTLAPFILYPPWTFLLQKTTNATGSRRPRILSLSFLCMAAQPLSEFDGMCPCY